MADRARVGQFIVKKITRKSEIENLTVAERIRLSFEELGPTFIKFGQLLSTRPNLIPEEWAEEFKKFHDNVRPVSFSEIKKVIEEDLGQNTDTIFQEISENPLAAASIAQVHLGILKNGEHVAIKVLRPGIIDVIRQDLGVLYTIAGLMEKYVPESRPWNPKAMVDEFFKTLELETNFLVEANNIQRISQNFADDPHIKIPKVYTEFSTTRVLVQERLVGTPLSDRKAIDQMHLDREKIVYTGLEAFFKMVFRHGIFHGDLHAGNIFILPDGKIGVIDFGVVGRLTRSTQDAIANMLLALATEDYQSLAHEYVELAPYTPGLDFDQFAREVRDIIAPYHGLTFKNVNFGKLMLDSTAVAARYGVVMPSELMLFLKAVVTVEGMGRTILDDFDVLKFANDAASEILRNRYDPQRLGKDFLNLAKDATSLIYILPRQLKQLLRKISAKDFAVDLSVREIESVKRAVEVSGSLSYLGTVVAGLLVAGALTLETQRGAMIGDIPVISLTFFTLAFLMAVVAFYNYLKK